MNREEIINYNGKIIDMYTFEQIKSSELVFSIQQYDVGSRISNHWLTIALLNDNTIINFYLPFRLQNLE